MIHLKAMQKLCGELRTFKVNTKVVRKHRIHNKVNVKGHLIRKGRGEKRKQRKENAQLQT